jgi:HAD superfamily hydrolase (TIGR01509 family)
MKYRAILFDLGQTLLEYPGNTHEFWRLFLEQRLRDMHPLFLERAEAVDDSPDAFMQQAIEIMWRERRVNMNGQSWAFRERLRAVLSHYGCPEYEEADLEQLTDDFYTPIGAGTRRYEETLAVLEELRSKGLRFAIISNAPWDVPGRLLRADMECWDLAGYFETMVMSGEVPWRKPNPEFMWAAARELGVTPNECLVVGDSLPADIAGARAAGMDCVWVNRAGLTRREEEAQPDHEVADLRPLVEIALSR